MKTVLTLIKLSELPEHTPTDPLGYFDAVSLKLASWTRSFGHRLDRLNIERHGWDWIDPGGTTPERLGKKHGMACRKWRLATFYVNCEIDWSNSLAPYDFLTRYIRALRAFAPSNTKIAYNGFSWAKNSRHMLLHDAKLMRMFDIWSPMNYGTSRAVIAKHWDEKVYKYVDLEHLDIYPMVGVGRIDSKGKIWGFWSDGTRWPGLHSLLLNSKGIDGVCFFLGNGAGEQLLLGNKYHPPLVRVADEITHMTEV